MVSHQALSSKIISLKHGGPTCDDGYAVLSKPALKGELNELSKIHRLGSHTSLPLLKWWKDKKHKVLVCVIWNHTNYANIYIVHYFSYRFWDF